MLWKSCGVNDTTEDEWLHSCNLEHFENDISALSHEGYDTFSVGISCPPVLQLRTTGTPRPDQEASLLVILRRFAGDVRSTPLPSSDSIARLLRNPGIPSS